MTPIGTVAAIRRYPVKSMQGEANTAYAPVLESDQPCLGAYAFVESTGALRVGDPVRLD